MKTRLVVTALLLGFACAISVAGIAAQKVTSLPRSALAALARAYSGWTEVPTSEFDQNVLISIERHEGPAALPQRIAGDFDGNGLRDYALIIWKGNNIQVVAMRQLRRGRWAIDTIGNRRTGSASAQVGYRGFAFYLALKRPGTISYWPSNSTNGKSGRLALKHDGIEVVNVSSAMLYYWNGKGYSKVQTAD